MKSRAPLALMEQMVMLLVFALAASLCLQAFAKSDEISLKSYKRSKAALAAQNTAEILRHSGGSLEHALTETAEALGGDYADSDSCLRIIYDEEWNVTKENGCYLLTAEGVPAPEKDLRKVQVQIFDISGMQGKAEADSLAELEEQDALFELETAWLEVKPDE